MLHAPATGEDRVVKVHRVARREHPGRACSQHGVGLDEAVAIKGHAAVFQKFRGRNHACGKDDQVRRQSLAAQRFDPLEAVCSSKARDSIVQTDRDPTLPGDRLEEHRNFRRLKKGKYARPPFDQGNRKPEFL